MPTSLASETDLLAKAAAGDRWSLETLLMRFHDPLLHFVSHSLLRTRQKSSPIPPEDILQETLMEAFRSIRTFQPRGAHSFFAWLKTIARSRFLNMLEAHHAKKRGGGQPHLQEAANPDITAVSLLARIAGTDPTPSWIARRKEVLHAVTAALPALSDPQRQLIDLRYRQSLTAEEIARRLNKSPGAVKMLLNRTIKQLQAILAQNFGNSSLGA